MKILLIVALLLTSCSPSSVDNHVHQGIPIKGNGIYIVCLNQKCVTPYGSDEVSASHSRVKVINNKIVKAENGMLNALTPCQCSDVFTDVNCDYSYDIIEFVKTISKNDTVPFK